MHATFVWYKDSFSATRFVKCEKCNHFFVVIPENESKKGLKDGRDEKIIHKRKPPPPPKKVCIPCWLPVVFTANLCSI